MVYVQIYSQSKFIVKSVQFFQFTLRPDVQKNVLKEDVIIHICFVFVTSWIHKVKF